MASMGIKERAQQYLERLVKASNPKAELEKIYSDLNGLVFKSTNKPIDYNTKIQILDELEKLVSRLLKYPLIMSTKWSGQAL